MSLSKQLGLGFFTILLFIFIGTLWLNVNNTREFVEQQLQSHAQDTATSLGLSISPYIGDESSLAVIETMQQAIFDSGYYRNIKLSDVDGKTLIELNNPDVGESVPTWFISLFPLQAPVASTQINDGWNIRGNLSVTTNVGLGYRQLYSNAQDSFIVFLIAFALTALFVWILISRVVSKPLNDVLHQVEGISEQKFETIEDKPKTPEFAIIVNALNAMSKKLSQLIAQMTKQSEQYRQFAYVDLVTDVGNRRAFELGMEKLLNSQNSHSDGYVFLVRASSLGIIHKQIGGKAGDEYLKALSQIIKDTASEYLQQYSLYRANGAEFALVAEGMDESAASNLATKICQASKRLEKSEHSLGVAHIGAAQYSSSMNLTELMEKADSALANAMEQENRWFLAENNTVSYSNEVWRDKLNAIIDKGLAEFVQQPVVTSRDNQTVYQEWFARLPDKENSHGLPMNQLIPASIKLDYAVQIDKLIVTNLLKQAIHSESDIGLNLSRFSLLDRAFTDWLFETLNKQSAICHKIVLEIPERALIQDCDYMFQLVEKMKTLGLKIAVEHFGAQLAGITHLRNVKPDFLKIDGRFIRNIDKHVDNQLFVSSLISIANGLSIRVIAEMVETESEFQWLRSAGIDMLQGYFIASPQ